MYINLDKASYGNFKDLTGITAPDKILRDKEFKGADATCVKIATEMKKYSRKCFYSKKCPISMFSEICSSYKHVLAALFRK